MNDDLISSIELKQHISTLRVLLTTLNACLGTFFVGYNIGVLNLADAKTLLQYNVKKEDLEMYSGILTSAMPFGAAFGALMSSYLLQQFGRRKTMILADLAGIMATILFLKVDLPVGIAARLISGIVSGINSSVVPTYIREISPVQLSGLTGSLNQVSISFGVVVAFTLGLGFGANPPYSSNAYWFLVLCFPIIPCFVRLFVFTFILQYDTPLQYMIMNQSEQAEIAVRQIYQPLYCEEIVEETRLIAQNQAACKLNYIVMFQKRYRYRTFLGLSTQIFQQLSGINAITFFSVVIFSATLPNQHTLTNLLVLGQALIGTITSLICGLLLIHFGRKSIMVMGQLGCAVTMAIMGLLRFIDVSQGDGGERNFTLSVVLIVILFVYLIIFNLSLGPVAWVYCADILPETGMSLAASSNLTFCFLIGLVSPIFLGTQGNIQSIYPVFFFFSGCSLLGGIIFQIYMKETKDLSTEEIGRMFELNGNVSTRLNQQNKLTAISET